ncbi:hypothetical protein OH492_11310 [Vibrio chagasii]|nr:hypothetical protein [Vibrio chagasii]
MEGFSCSSNLDRRRSWLAPAHRWDLGHLDPSQFKTLFLVTGKQRHQRNVAWFVHTSLSGHKAFVSTGDGKPSCACLCSTRSCWRILVCRWHLNNERQARDVSWFAQLAVVVSRVLANLRQATRRLVIFLLCATLCLVKQDLSSKRHLLTKNTEFLLIGEVASGQ